MAADLVLRSPLDGWATPLAEVTDPVFAQQMLGDGVAVDPTGSMLHAPCDAVVIDVHPARHAVTLKAEGGLELLLHVGLETVALRGAGFDAQVVAGQSVRPGDPLIAFDLDLLARRAASLVSPMVITNPGAFAISARVSDRPVAVGDPLIELARTAAPAEAVTTPVAGQELTRRITIPLPHGLHARPAARVAACAAGFQAESALTRAGRRAATRSPVALMTLGLQQGDEAVLSATGPDAEAALAALAALIEGGMGEAAAAPPLRVPAADAPRPPDQPGLLTGTPAAPGLAIGRAFHLVRTDVPVPESGAGVGLERAALAGALAKVRDGIEAQRQAADPIRATILAAHLALAQDPELAGEADRQIAEGRSAAFAWRAAVNGFAEALGALADRRMAERVDDLKDLERQVVGLLVGDDGVEPEVPAGAILLADELLPSQLMALAPGRLAGLCTARGGPTSHVAILAAAMGLPAVVAAGPGVLTIGDGATLILDADAGTVRTGPDARALEEAQRQLARRAQQQAAARTAAHEPARLADGRPLPVCVNLGGVAEAGPAVAAGAEGCGLLRTEFLFLERETPPDEDEQAAAYGAIAAALDSRPLVIRLLDIGGDKPAAYLPMPAEENPALGVRGVRLALRRPEILRTQVRAAVRAAAGGANCKLMVPMVSRLSELHAVRAVLDEARADLDVTARIELGVMIETPAAAMIADLLAADADFLSIGTNDLTQYALAMDRGNPDLAAEVDSLDPAVLRLIARTCEAARPHATEVSVCGALAGDLAAIPILIGLGVERLSMAAGAIPEAKALIRTLSFDACATLAKQALAQASAADVRALTARPGGA